RLVAIDMQRAVATGDRIGGTLVFERSGTVAIVYAVPLGAVGAHAPPLGSLGSPFHLVDQLGRDFASTRLADRPYAIFFGFTHCPAICPTTLLVISNLLSALGQDADRLNVVFVTVDPERDTSANLKEYLASFHPRIIGLTGSEASIAGV